MYAVTFTYEREDDCVYLFADLDGFYLWAIDVDVALRSIVPLVQHLFWHNERICVATSEEPDFTTLLIENTMTIEFQIVSQLTSPKILVDGEWWTRPDGKKFYMPMATDKGVPEKIVKRIMQDLDTSGFSPT